MSRRSVRLVDPSQFADIIIKSDNEGRVTRVGDVGRVELGAVDYGANGYKDHERSVPILIYRRPGSNELATGVRSGRPWSSCPRTSRPASPT